MYVCASKAEAFRLLTRRTAIVRKSRMEIRCAGASTMQFRRVGNHPFFTPLPYVPPPVGASFEPSLFPHPSALVPSFFRLLYPPVRLPVPHGYAPPSLASVLSLILPTRATSSSSSSSIATPLPLVKRVCSSARESVPKTLL